MRARVETSLRKDGRAKAFIFVQPSDGAEPY
jgi:hypothetical protein